MLILAHRCFWFTTTFQISASAHLAAVIAWAAKERGDKIGGLIASAQTHRERNPKSRQQGVANFSISLTFTQCRAGTTRSSRQLIALESACVRLRRLAMPVV